MRSVRAVSPGGARSRRLSAPTLALGLALVLAAVGPTSAQTPPQQVMLAGSLGQSKALLMVNGQPLTLGLGQSAGGVTLRSLSDGQAEVLVGGQTLLLRLGASPARVGAAGKVPGTGTEIVMAAGPGGHFLSGGSINGAAVQFMVDTGATTVALSQTEATRIGLDWRRGRPGISHTAGGPVPVYAVNLTSVRVGDVELSNVAAVVLPAEMPLVLLGNSFLSRFSMRRDADVMRLEIKR